jgi:alpha-pyrone synthase
MQLNDTQPSTRPLDATTFNPHIDELGRRGIAEVERVRPNPLVTTIESIATGNPDCVIRQSDAAKVVANMPNLVKHRERIEKIYQNTRIDTRYLALDLLSDEAIAFSRSATLQARMQLYREHAIPLAEKVAKKALKSASGNHKAEHPFALDPIEATIGSIVFVSSTGFVAPGVDTAIVERLGLRRDIARVTINFMGCAAAMNGLQVASSFVRANPHQRALVICLELSSLNAVFEDDLNDLIIHSIFGDGCAAIVVGASEAEAIADGRLAGKVIIKDRFSHLFEHTEDGIVLGVQDNGITCTLSRQLPEYIEAGVDPVVSQFLLGHGLTKADIDAWAIHPGGTKIIESAKRSLGLDDTQVADSWAVLAKYGNMLSPSILYVLERMLLRWETESHSQVQNGLAFSFSPGVGIEGILFQKV